MPRHLRRVVADEVVATALGAGPSAETLRKFVRCTVMLVESDDYFAMEALEGDAHWIDEAQSVYVLDMLGSEMMSGGPFWVNGLAPHE